MKKLLAIVLIIVMLMPVGSLAANHVENVYTLFIDGDLYNRTYNTTFDFDSMVFDMIVMSDGRTAYYSKQTWNYGVRSTTDVVECDFSSDGGTFIITFPDGTQFDGYFEKDGSGAWVNLGSNSYFKFVTVHRYDITEDYVRK